MKIRRARFQKDLRAAQVDSLRSYDLVVAATTGRSCCDCNFILDHATLVADTRNATNGAVKKSHAKPVKV